MKKFILTALTIAIMSIGAVYAADVQQKIAIVNVQKIVDNSAQIQALNKEQQTKITELEKWIETAKKDVDKQQTQEGKEKLLIKYRATYEQKKLDIIKDGQTKMQTIMNNISDTIAAQAKAKGYTMVISNAVVVYGGEDITDDVQNALKNKPVSAAGSKKVIKSAKSKK